MFKNSWERMKVVWICVMAEMGKQMKRTMRSTVPFVADFSEEEGSIIFSLSIGYDLIILDLLNLEMSTAAISTSTDTDIIVDMGTASPIQKKTGTRGRLASSRNGESYLESVWGRTLGEKNFGRQRYLQFGLGYSRLDRIEFIISIKHLRDLR